MADAPERDAHAQYEALRIERPALFTDRAPDCYPLLPGGAVRARNEHLLLIDDRVRTPSGQETSYLRIVAPQSGAPGAAILPIVGGSIVLLDHPRHALGRRLLEVPRGFGEPGETAAACAERELAEELGVTPLRLIPIGLLYPDSGLLAVEVSLFAAEIPPRGWKTEPGVSTREMSVADGESAVRDGRIADSFTIACLYRARLMGLI